MVITCCVFILSRYGFVKFSNPEDAKEGLKLNGVVVQQQALEVDYAQVLSPSGKLFRCTSIILFRVQELACFSF